MTSKGMTGKRQGPDPRDTLTRAIVSRQRILFAREATRAAGFTLGDGQRTEAIHRLDRQIARLKSVTEPLPELNMDWGPTP